MKIVHFAIPVAPRRDDEQWARVGELLRMTLGSIVNQSDDRYHIHVCAHQKPDVLREPAFERVSFIKARFAIPEKDEAKRRDKRKKRWEIARAVRAMGGGYFVHMDADDLVHRDFVSHILEDHNQSGYFIREGYALDFLNRKLAPIPGAFNKPFNAVCGSSGAIYLLPEDLPTDSFALGDGTTLYEQIRSHKYFGEGAGRNGEPLAPIPFPAGIYTLNNAVNLSNILVRTEERQEQLVRGIVTRMVDDIDAVAPLFGLDPAFFAEPSEAAGYRIAQPLTSLSKRGEDPPAPIAPPAPVAVAAPKPQRRSLGEAEAQEAIRPHARQLASVLEYLERTGWLASAHVKRAADPKGRPIPWYTYPAIHFLAPRVKKTFSVFEYGSGSSTLWWAERARKVVTVEHDQEWAEITRTRLPANAELLALPLTIDGDYARASADQGDLFDVIAIDGRDRNNCARHALAALKPDGVIIWDNTERKRYRPGFDPLFEAGFRRIEFRGLAPIRGKGLETSIFYRADNCLGI